jgi:hypothetical protein
VRQAVRIVIAHFVSTKLVSLDAEKARSIAARNRAAHAGFKAKKMAPLGAIRIGHHNRRRAIDQRVRLPPVTECHRGITRFAVRHLSDNVYRRSIQQKSPLAG